MELFSKKSGIVIFHVGAFGGASKRYTNLFLFLNQKYPQKIYYIINNDLFKHINNLFPNVSLDNIIVIGEPKKKFSLRKSKETNKVEHIEKSNNIVDQKFITKLKLEDRISIFRKLYWYLKNYYRQYQLYKEIENIRTEYGIEAFMGVYSGILPLYFYFNRKKRPTIIFSDMDSWFYEIHPEEKKYWYRKYYSFNYAFKQCDKIDFLSPFIYKGVCKTGIKIKEDSVSITPCSFADYTKCSVGRKQDFGIAFAGRLEKNKNPFVFIEAAKIILERHPAVKFYLLGDGQLKEEITEILLEYDLNEKIVFQFHPNPPEVFAETSVFVSLQATNNYPSQSILEAMACGNTIIATDVGDTRMFVNESNGILITPDLNALVNAIEKLVLDKEKTIQLGRNAREYVLMTHNIEVHADYYLKLLENALENSNMK